MVLIDDVYLCMGSHLREVFENKLKTVISEIDELKVEMLFIEVRDKVPEALSSLKRALDMGIKEIWDKLEL